MSRTAPKIQLNNFNELFGITEGDADVVEVKLSDLHTFKNHPFLVKDDEKMAELIESIRVNGVLVPGIVRPRKAGGYEIIAGHRRKRASEIAGRMTMPVIVRDLPDAEAVIAMVDSNFQRENILPSEKARSYKMKYNAMKHQGKNRGEGRSIDAIGEAAGESGKTIQRYMHLADLVDELLQMLDDKKLGLAQGYEISFIRPKTQRMIADVIISKEASVSGAQAAKLKEYAERDELTEAMVELILSEEQPKPKRMVLKPARIEKIFERFSLSHEEIEEKIYQVLEEWASQQSGD